MRNGRGRIPSEPYALIIPTGTTLRGIIRSVPSASGVTLPPATDEQHYPLDNAQSNALLDLHPSQGAETSSGSGCTEGTYIG